MRFLYILLALGIQSCLSVKSAVSANEDQLIFANVVCTLENLLTEFHFFLT